MKIITKILQTLLQNLHIAFGPLLHVPLFSWRFHQYGFIYGAGLYRFSKRNQNLCSLSEEIVIFLWGGSTWRVPKFGCRMSVFTGHRPVVDKLLNTEYEWNPALARDTSVKTSRLILWSWQYIQFLYYMHRNYRHAVITRMWHPSGLTILWRRLRTWPVNYYGGMVHAKASHM